MNNRIVILKRCLRWLARGVVRLVIAEPLAWIFIVVFIVVGVFSLAEKFGVNLATELSWMSAGSSILVGLLIILIIMVAWSVWCVWDFVSHFGGQDDSLEDKNTSGSVPKNSFISIIINIALIILPGFLTYPVWCGMYVFSHVYPMPMPEMPILLMALILGATIFILPRIRSNSVRTFTFASITIGCFFGFQCTIGPELGLREIVNIAGAIFIIVSISEVPRVARVIRNNSGRDSSIAESQQERSKFSKLLTSIYAPLVAIILGVFFALLIHGVYIAHRMISLEIIGWLYPFFLYGALMGTKAYFIVTSQSQRKHGFLFIVLGFFMMGSNLVLNTGADSYPLF